MSDQYVTTCLYPVYIFTAFTCVYVSRRVIVSMCMFRVLYPFQCCLLQMVVQRNDNKRPVVGLYAQGNGDAPGRQVHLPVVQQHAQAVINRKVILPRVDDGGLQPG